jgi:putative SOS response-associated peptidase YedK
VCGRYASTTTDKELRSIFHVDEVVGDELRPSYNIAPTQQIRAVLERAPREESDAKPVTQIRTLTCGPAP